MNTLAKIYYEYEKIIEQLRFTLLYLQQILRTDIAKKILLAFIISNGSIREKTQLLGLDYNTTLKNLEKLANLDIIQVVKEKVKGHRILLIVDDTIDEKPYAQNPVSKILSQLFFSYSRKDFIPGLQLLIIVVLDLDTNEYYPVIVDVFIPRKIKDFLEKQGIKVEFKTKIELTEEYVKLLRKEFRDAEIVEGGSEELGNEVNSESWVVGVVFDSWYVNYKTLGLGNVTGEFKRSARVVEGGVSVRVSELPAGFYDVEYHGRKLRLLVVDDYAVSKRREKRSFFTTDLSMSAEELLTTWRCRWIVEEVIRELKGLGLKNVYFYSVDRYKGFFKVLTLVLVALLSVRFSLGVNVGVRVICRALKKVYLMVGDYRKLFSHLKL